MTVTTCIAMILMHFISR